MSKRASPTQQEPLFENLDLSRLHQVETISEENAEKYSFDTLNFSDINRPKSCLEVDFPILKVNEISIIEGNATKPIYMMSKWWARRRSAIFRQLLIAAATKAPLNPEDASQTAWSLMYRKSHRKHGKFNKLSVVDIFMGGGTTVVEAARLGFQVTGVDFNPFVGCF
jgi:putative DNA methylase